MPGAFWLSMQSQITSHKLKKYFWVKGFLIFIVTKRDFASIWKKRNLKMCQPLAKDFNNFHDESNAFSL